MSNMPYEKDFNIQMAITIEFSMKQLVIARTGYTFLDMLSDVGGIQSLLMSGFAVWLNIWNHKNFDNYLASKLFKVKKIGKSNDLQESIEPFRCFNIIEFLLGLTPRRLKCCKKSHRLKNFEKARH